MATALTRSLSLSTVELRLLFRNRVVAMTAVAMPLVMSALVLMQDQASEPQGWGITIGVFAVVNVLLAVYVTATTTLAARSQSLMLKRLRASEITDSGLIAGMVAPVALLGLLQVGLFLVAEFVAGAPAPSQPLLLVAGVVGAITVAAAAGAATSVITATPERAQITTMPLLIVGLGATVGLQLVTVPELKLALLAAPLTATADLIARAWGGGVQVDVGGLPLVPLELGVTALWAALFAFAAMRWFRWEPRS